MSVSNDQTPPFILSRGNIYYLTVVGIAILWTWLSRAYPVTDMGPATSSVQVTVRF